MATYGGIDLSQERILIVDDEKELVDLIKDYLDEEGYRVSCAYDGEAALQIFKNNPPELVILDIMLPKVDGMEVCRQIRAMSNVPILMLSSKKSDIDKILSLGLGADDYVTKPFSPGELVARVKAQLRRYIHLSKEVQPSLNISYGGLLMDLKSYCVYRDGKQILLSAKEFEILKLFMTHPFQVFTREQIFDQIWGFNEYGDINTVTVHIRRIREKIETDPSNPEYIKTVWGIGYKFEGGKK